ncbi:hypothetical protein EJB05_09588 [Eragrostis curvula]|uniref:Uncharacterized protein n=1 Tax=Eragrostis curvula TaxID=38414 RepID=A0A5J9W5C9_9POAL|nr:hypothetical protein EJB05_09588 [Eragrostis curvula]
MPAEVHGGPRGNGHERLRRPRLLRPRLRRARSGCVGVQASTRPTALVAMPTTGSAPPTAPCFIAILVDNGLVVPLWDPPVPSATTRLSVFQLLKLFILNVLQTITLAKKPPNSSTFRVIRSCNIWSNIEDKETLMLIVSTGNILVHDKA